MKNDKLFELAMSVKAKLLLGNARMQQRVELSAELINGLDVNVLNNRINYDLTRALSKQILEKYSGHIQAESKNGKLLKSIDLMIVPTDSFKYVIEETIKLMPQLNLDQLRSNH